MSLARSSLVFGFGTLISRFSGLIRDMVVTHLLGAGALNDAFVIAQRIPNLLRDMLAEGALGSSFTKVYTALKEENTFEAERLLFQMLYLALGFTTLLVALGFVFAPFLVKMMNLGVENEISSDPLTVNLTRVLFPSLSLTVLGAIAMGALYEKGRFFFNSVIPILANLGVVLGGVFCFECIEWFGMSGRISRDEASVYGLAIGTLLGFVAQSAVSLWAVRSTLIKFAKSFWAANPWSTHVKKVMTLMVPAAIAGSAGPINSLVNTNFATSVGPGAVTWLSYAFRLVQLPIGIFGVAVGVYALPALTRSVVKAGKKIDERVSLELQNAVVFVVWLLTPCMIYSICFHYEIINIIFGHGKFLNSDVVSTGNALWVYSLSMVGYGLIKVMTAFYYSIDRTKSAMKVSLFGILINLIGNVFLVKSLGHIGLAATSSITLSLNALFLLVGSYRLGVTWDFKVCLKHVALISLACIVFLISNQFILHKTTIIEQASALLIEGFPKASLLHVYSEKIKDTFSIGIGAIILFASFGLAGGFAWKTGSSTKLKN